MSIAQRSFLIRSIRSLMRMRGGEGAAVEVKRRAILTLIVCYVGGALSLVFSIIALTQGKWTVGAIDFAVAATLGAMGAYIRLVGYHAGLSYIGGAASGALFVYLFVSGGISGSGHLWPLTFPLFVLFTFGANKGAVASLLLLTALVFCSAFDRQLGVTVRYSAAFKSSFFAAYTVILAFAYFFERTREVTQGQLAGRNLDLEEIATLLKGTLESTGDGILVVGTDGEVLATNDQFGEMWRLPAEVLAIGEAERIFDHAVEQLADPVAGRARVAQIYRSDEVVTDTLRLKDHRELERRSAPLVVGGTVRGRVWSYRDTTERLRVEQERTRLAAELQRSQKMEALGTLAGGVAHDLNNILAGVVGLPDLLLAQVAEDSPIRHDLQTVRASGIKASLIVRDLLTLARRNLPSNTVLNLNDVARAYLESPEHRDLLSLHPGVAVETRLAEDLLNAAGSASHLNKTVMNLVFNAAEAMPDGGEILIETENRYVDTPVLGYDAVKEGEYVLLTVSDHGIGIASEHIEHIFEPFYTKKRMGRSSGSGLGLAVIWGAVKDLNGYIDVQSVVGEGTTFTLYLPATRDAAGVEPVAAPEVHRGAGQSVLVVDDMPEQRDLATRMLSSLGYTATAVASGEEAVAWLEDHEVALVVLDMIMAPGIDGLETYRQILARRPGQRAIIASGYSETDRVREAQKLGAGRYLRKPYILAKLGVVVREALSQS